jgi:hypothetical protein
MSKPIKRVETLRLFGEAIGHNNHGDVEKMITLDRSLANTDVYYSFMSYHITSLLLTDVYNDI